MSACLSILTSYCLSIFVYVSSNILSIFVSAASYCQWIFVYVASNYICNYLSIYVSILASSAGLKIDY